ncbi:unnamed protein product, partial [Symbiodinium sp. KB8]
ELGLRFPDLADPGFQLFLCWVFSSQLLAAFPDIKRGRDAFREAGLVVQIAWNASCVWKWFFLYCWVQQSTLHRAGPVPALLTSCLFFTLFHVGTQDRAYLRKAWFVNLFFAVPFMLH